MEVGGVQKTQGGQGPSGAQCSNPPALFQSTFPISDNTPSTDKHFNNQKHIYFGFWNNLQLLISIFSE